MLAKVDIQSAYRLIPVHPDDRLLFALQWKGRVIVKVIVPFGLHSVSKNIYGSGGQAGMNNKAVGCTGNQALPGQFRAMSTITTNMPAEFGHSPFSVC